MKKKSYKAKRPWYDKRGWIPTEGSARAGNEWLRTMRAKYRSL